MNSLCKQHFCYRICNIERELETKTATKMNYSRARLFYIVPYSENANNSKHTAFLAVHQAQIRADHLLPGNIWRPIKKPGGAPAMIYRAARWKIQRSNWSHAFHAFHVKFLSYHSMRLKGLYLSQTERVSGNTKRFEYDEKNRCNSQEFCTIWFSGLYDLMIICYFTFHLISKIITGDNVIQWYKKYFFVKLFDVKCIFVSVNFI